MCPTKMCLFNISWQTRQDGIESATARVFGKRRKCKQQKHERQFNMSWVHTGRGSSALQPSLNETNWNIVETRSNNEFINLFQTGTSQAEVSPETIFPSSTYPFAIYTFLSSPCLVGIKSQNESCNKL